MAAFRSIVLLVALVALAGCATPSAAPRTPAAPALAELNLDYAYYSPTSLVLKRMGWVEEAFKPQNTTVKWVLSAGSNKAVEYLSGNAVDFGSTAGAAALLARTNDVPIKAVYIYAQPEWTALVVGKESTIKRPSELKGKKVAATKGTDPYFFLLRTLNANALSQSDVEIVNLQHDQGRLAFERGQVDAWAGLDPHMAASELEAGSRLIYRNKDFNTYGFLNAREAFVSQQPEATRKVIELYDRARKWTLDHPEEATKILSEESQVSPDVARRELVERMDLNANGVPGDAHIAALKAVIPIMKAENLVKDGSDPDRALAELIDPT
ncbi:MAG: aliphatic sulfonate ABC transporter substrate-binding protein, partial [Chloroflexota bacterium]|nr:aliphatic sulfonate ABC transporter substrate-binding protein [Chloroflexota bacterium]